jgi:hypothetical protein
MASTDLPHAPRCPDDHRVGLAVGEGCDAATERQQRPVTIVAPPPA